MEINALNAQYLNQTYVPFSTQTGSVPGLASNGPDGFAEILKHTQNTRQIQSAPASAKTPDIDKNDKLYELCMELETFLIKNLIKSMRGTVQKSKLIDTGFAGEIYEDMLYDEYAKGFAKNANFGFAEMAYRDLKSIR